MRWPWTRRRLTQRSPKPIAEVEPASAPAGGAAGSRPARHWARLSAIGYTVRTTPPILMPLLRLPDTATTSTVTGGGRPLLTLHHRPRPAAADAPRGRVNGLVGAGQPVVREPSRIGEVTQADGFVPAPVVVEPRSLPVVEPPAIRARLTVATEELLGEPVAPATPFANLSEFDRLVARYESIPIELALQGLESTPFNGPPPLADEQPSRSSPLAQRSGSRAANLGQSRRRGVAPPPAADPSTSDDPTDDTDDPEPVVAEVPRTVLAPLWQPVPVKDERTSDGPDEPPSDPPSDPPGSAGPAADAPEPQVTALPVVPSAMRRSTSATPRPRPAQPQAPQPTAPTPSAPLPPAPPLPAPPPLPVPPSPVRQLDVLQPPAPPSPVPHSVMPRPAMPQPAMPQAPIAHPPIAHPPSVLPAAYRREARPLVDEPPVGPPAVTRSATAPITAPPRPIGPPRTDQVTTLEPAVPPSAPAVAARLVAPRVVAVLNQRLGVDLAEVPVVRGRAAALLAPHPGTRAFTRAGVVHLPDEADPTRADAGLFAHELTHAAQQLGLGTALPAPHSAGWQRLEAEATAVERWVDGSRQAPPRLAHRPATTPPAPAPPAPVDAVQFAPVEAEQLSWTPDDGFHPTNQPSTTDETNPATAPPQTIHLVRPDQQPRVEQAPTPPAPPTVPVEASRHQCVDLTDLRTVEDLAGRLYRFLRTRLRAELLIDRERAGLLADR